MDTKYWIAFSSIEEIDSQFILALFEHFGDIQRAFEADINDLIEFSAQTSGKYKKRIDEFVKRRDKIDIDKAYNSVLERDIKIIKYTDENYPYMLKQISNPPAVLYCKGDLSVCNLKRTLAIVGSRRLTRNGQDSLKKVMKGLAGTDLCVVSGLATGADTCAHRFALDMGLKTIGVIGSGFDFVYPASNRALYQEIIDGNGAILTEYFPTFEPLAFRFPQRNRIVSGLSYGTLVVEAALRSGASITANLTLEQGRELMCIPGLITNPNTAGIYKMIKTGATIVTEGEDILNALNWTIDKQIPLFKEEKTKDKSENKTEENAENTENDGNEEPTVEEIILEFVKTEPKSFDEIQKETGADVNDLLMKLTTLELLGQIEKTVGDRYRTAI